MMRAWVLACAVAAAVSGGTSPACAARLPGRVEFEVLREGEPFGLQTITVSEHDGQLVAESDANLRASFGPLTLFSYSQRCSETWRGGALTSLQCATRKNGRLKAVLGQLDNGALHMSGTVGDIVFDAGTPPTSWWTRPPLTLREMINSETGERLPVRVSYIGRETITAYGQRLAADHIRVQGTLGVDLWYDDQGHWISCAFSAQGQHVTYRLLTPPALAPS